MSRNSCRDGAGHLLLFANCSIAWSVVMSPRSHDLSVVQSLIAISREWFHINLPIIEWCPLFSYIKQSHAHSRTEWCHMAFRIVRDDYMKWVPYGFDGGNAISTHPCLRELKIEWWHLLYRREAHRIPCLYAPAWSAKYSNESYPAKKKKEDKMPPACVHAAI